MTLVQYRENLSDRQAAEAVRARIDVKYLLGLPLEDAGFDYSALSEFRARLQGGSKEATLLDRLLERCRELGLVRAGGRACTDATRVLAAVRVMNRLELVAETLRAALNELARAAPAWLIAVAPAAWFERYARRIEDSRLPASKAAREAYATTVGEDGYLLLDLLKSAPAGLADLPVVAVLARVWERHFSRSDGPNGDGAQVRLRPERKLVKAAEATESPYDPDARGAYVVARFATATCRACPLRSHCTRSGKQGRSLHLHPRDAHEAIGAMRERLASNAGRELYALRAGVEGTISQGVRALGLRRARYRSLARVHLQHVATAAAMNIDRVTNFLAGRPVERTRTLRFAALRA